MKKKIIIIGSILLLVIATAGIGQRFGYWDLKKLKGYILFTLPAKPATGSLPKYPNLFPTRPAAPLPTWNDYGWSTKPGEITVPTAPTPKWSLSKPSPALTTPELPNPSKPRTTCTSELGPLDPETGCGNGTPLTVTPAPQLP